MSVDVVVRHQLMRFGSLICGLLVSGLSHAQSRGFAADRFEPAERGSDWFTSESLDLRGDGRLAVGGTLDYAHAPLVAYDQNGDPAAKLVSRQLFLHVGAAYTLMNRLRFGISIPALVDSAGENVAASSGNFTSPSGAALGDIRLGGDVRILGDYEKPLTLAAGVWVYVPNGSTGNFASDGSTRVQPRVAVAGRLGSFQYAAKTGVNVRTVDQNFANTPFGTEWQFAAAAGARLIDDKLLLGPEFWGSTVVVDSGAFDKEATPVEVLLGAHYRHEDFNFGAGAGPGLTKGMGSPAFRVLLSVDYAPLPPPPPPPSVPEPPSDRDNDGIIDDQDACPDTAGVSSDDPEKHGCPPPQDTDKDGIVDPEDACPEVKGVQHEDEDKNGCPPDTDGDGILDSKDACPDEPGVAGDDPETHGCPIPPDRDEDGVIDAEDACPDTPGPRREPAEKNGCPHARVTKTKVEILDRIEFDTGKASLRPESDSVLQDVFEILEAHPEIELVSIEGHTDNAGSRWLNRKLSANRAKAVVLWLVEHGISAKRLTSKGFGPDKPIDSNDTPEGRQNNRRVEFQIVRRAAEKTEEDAE